MDNDVQRTGLSGSGDSGAEFAELIKRLEKAAGPDRDLDRAIMDAVGTIVKEFDPGDGDVSQWREWPDGARIQNTHVTGSIDAAVALMPDGANCHGYDLDVNEVDAYFSLNNVASGHWLACGHHKTSVPIAFCIAALEARAALSKAETK